MPLLIRGDMVTNWVEQVSFIVEHPTFGRGKAWRISGSEAIPR